MFRFVAWFFRTPWLALFRVFACAWFAAAVVTEVAVGKLPPGTWQLVAAAASFLLAGAVAAAWASSHHSARKWVGYVVEGLLFWSVVGVLGGALWTVPLMVAGAVLVELHGRFAAIRPGRMFAPLGRALAALGRQISEPPRRAAAALHARLSRSAREQRRTDRTFSELVSTLDLDTTP